MNINSKKVGYVVKRYPRFSETFIVNEVLAHEAAGAEIEVFSIRPCNDTHFQNRISEVRAPLTQLISARPKASAFLDQLRLAAEEFDNLWELVAEEKHADVTTLNQGVMLARLVRQRNIGHLHAHFATLPASVTRLAAKLAQIPYTLTAHAKDIFHESVDPDDLRCKLHDASGVITVSDFNVEFLTREYGCDPGRLHRIYNGLDLADVPFASPTERPPRIIGVGRLVEKKGFADLVSACAGLNQRGVKFHCQIVGGGEEEQELRDLIAHNRLQEQVELTGPIPQSELKSLIQDAAVMATPCVVGNDGNRDGLPTVLLESMALGTPCIATPVTGIPEVIRHEETGLIVPERNSYELSVALERMLEDGELRTRLARAARDLIEAEFDNRKTAAQIREIFLQCRHATPAEMQEAS